MKLEACLAASPELATALYVAASEIVDDFDDYGPVLQANEHGSYDASTAIEKLREARSAVLSAMRASVC